MSKPILWASDDSKFHELNDKQKADLIIKFNEYCLNSPEQIIYVAEFQNCHPTILFVKDLFSKNKYRITFPKEIK